MAGIPKSCAARVRVAPVVMYIQAAPNAHAAVMYLKECRRALEGLVEGRECCSPGSGFPSGSIANAVQPRSVLAVDLWVGTTDRIVSASTTVMSSPRSPLGRAISLEWDL